MTAPGRVSAATGPVIDFAVKMRRFDEARLLDSIAARGELERPLVRALARELAFPAQLEAPLPAGRAAPSPARPRACWRPSSRISASCATTPRAPAG